MKNATRSGPARTPRFFWQGALIILPVAVLAVVSLASLHNDERTAEQDARKKAEESVQSLARAMRVTVNEDLYEFTVFQQAWAHLSRIRSKPLQGNDAPDVFAEWEHKYPAIKFVEQASPWAEILADGRQVWPPEIATVPVPPKWFSGLSPKQNKLWRALREADSANDSRGITNGLDAFLASDPPDEARQAASFLTSTPETVLSTSNVLQNESGISFQDIAACQLLQGTNGLSSVVLEGVWRQIFVTPTFAAPDLLELVEAQTNRVQPADREKIRHMREFWESELRTQDWLNPLRKTSAIGSTNGTVWIKGDSGREALAVFETVTNANDAEVQVFAQPGQRILFIPRPVMEAVFRRAMQENKFLVPDYATVALTVEGMELFEPAGSEGKKELLSSVAGRVLDDPEGPAVNFDLRFYLTGRDLMLAAEYRRAKLFGALILGTALTALVGLFAAWRAFHRQRQLNEMKSNFVSSVSHELRAPIASVRLMAENLEGGKVAELPKQREYFGFIVQECRRLTSLIENILDFSRIEQGRKQYEFEPTSVVELVIQTVRVMEVVGAEKGVRLALDTMPNETVELNVDGKAIQQALVNLIDNAIKHSEKGGVVRVGIERKAEVGKSGKRKAESGNGGQPRMDTNKHESGEHPTPNIQHRTSNETVCLFVEDDGRGIAEGEREKIFERFYRSGSELRRETQGVGIGLSIVKHIVEAHGGVVRVESEVGVGSRFTIELPG